jgi:hypothetical protein
MNIIVYDIVLSDLLYRRSTYDTCKTYDIRPSTSDVVEYRRCNVEYDIVGVTYDVVITDLRYRR